MVKLIGACLIFLLIIFALNVKVTMRYGVNGAAFKEKIPLYLKASRFILRHLEVKKLTKDVTAHHAVPSEKVACLFQWVINNIHAHPKAYDVMDDHPWHIIVRRYGANDQLNDVFTLMVSYTGIQSYYILLTTKENPVRHPVSLVYLNQKWYVFDICHKLFFLNQNNQWATIEDIRSGQFRINRLKNSHSLYDKGYFRSAFADWEIDPKGSQRNLGQMPLQRLLLFLKPL
jgi:hypothetical protein